MTRERHGKDCDCEVHRAMGWVDPFVIMAKDNPTSPWPAVAVAAIVITLTLLGLA